jgi:hypothetical protein
MPDRLLGDIDERRQKGIGNVITALRVLLHRMRKGPDSCSFECSSILLGALTKELDARNLLSPRPVPPFSGFSFEPTAESLSAIRSPCWYTRGQSYHQNIHRCTLNQHIDPIINSLNQHAGLTLEDYF